MVVYNDYEVFIDNSTTLWRQIELTLVYTYDSKFVSL